MRKPIRSASPAATSSTPTRSASPTPRWRRRPRVYDYDMETRARVLRKEQEVPSGHDPSRYVTRRIMAPAPDGEDSPDLAPLSQGHASSTAPRPALLYGYGAYGIAIPAGFSIARLSLVDRGFVYAIAHVRGGKDKGFAWYEIRHGASKGEHLLRLHRRGRASRRASASPRAEESSPRAARRAAC